MTKHGLLMMNLLQPLVLSLYNSPYIIVLSLYNSPYITGSPDGRSERKLPQGMSDYQASWIVDSDLSDNVSVCVCVGGCVYHVMYRLIAEMSGRIPPCHVTGLKMMTL